MSPTCFIHVGTHKTGTTAIQMALEKMSSDAFLVPKTGRSVPTIAGHHNIAYEMSGDQRFRPEDGTLSELLDELTSKRPPIAILSSEDFGHLYTHPQLLEPLKKALHSIGYETRIIIYLRPQTEYMPSLFAELVKHGLDISFTSFVTSIMTDGFFSYKDNWSFCLMYTIFINSFATVFGKNNIIVRRYHQELSNPTLLIQDFVSIFQKNIFEENKQYLTDIGYENNSLPLIGVIKALYANIQKTRAIEPPFFFLESMMNEEERKVLQYKFNALDQHDIEMIDTHFKDSNERIRSLYGVDLTTKAKKEQSEKLQKQIMNAVCNYWKL